ncbi:MAG: bifunctional diaminohydroxyphosphoribosylaminopyrimidine deaminase/5-amino-6-(5-phosphoribosylamino)uracil reductase RibD [Flavobacteriales bacterium]|jgi:diaminohydroxyphosphoribosylaminopyrimidine deaminase/5-amino-6-(5-phosphoribosylamino)uracil reductase|nr:bifunctional diaminohydroxyphosphoribosylaminopyrimidine deaminase/5-amino-6-(5-phosphoribosylamino)uracil reductase RibD [Flavobacteriales bacterium]|tara:strand:+ start:6457 stop:7530 length:1074 start_codon:yes stop_codon:yes gene_type:complete
MISHKKYIDIAIKLAEKGRGYVSPNPLVGCIIVKRGKIVGRGYHKKYGEEHAEINALKAAGKKANNATMYVNIEPCSHWGKTSPCTEKIVEAGIREVIVGVEDPNPLVDGYKELKFRGLKTRIGILRDKAKKLNEAYIKYTKTKKPFVILKLAMSLDGKIATSSGDSKYITSRAARKYVHQLRNDVDAVMVGINTITRDNPMLDSRLVKGKNPKKIVVDSSLKISERSKILKEPSKVIIATTKKAPRKKIDKLQHKGARIIILNPKKGLVDLKELAKELGKSEIASVMIEGGAELSGNAIKEGIVDKLLIFTAPKIIGNGLGPIKNLGIKKVNKAIKLKNILTKKIGKDFLVEGNLK